MMRYRCALAAVAGLAGLAGAQNIEVTIENTQDDGQFYLTPFWVGLHDGSFDVYDGGAFAYDFPGITQIAENGNTGPLSDRFASMVPGGVQGTFAATDGPDGAPVYAPGESSTFVLDAGDPTSNRYFSYASMVVPSNDLFVSNGDPMAHPIFGEDGSFLGPLVIEIYGMDVNDNGSEVNNAFGDAAFSANDGQSVAEYVEIRHLFTDDGDADYLASFVGTETAIGTTIESAFGPEQLIGRITIGPAPGALALGAFGIVAGLRRRR